MNKRLIIIAALIIAVMFTLSGCDLLAGLNKDPYSGNYKEVDGEEKQAVIESLQKTYDNTKNKNVKFSYSVSGRGTYVDTGEKMNTEEVFDTIIDGSDESNELVYVHYLYSGKADDFYMMEEGFLYYVKATRTLYMNALGTLKSGGTDTTYNDKVKKTNMDFSAGDYAETVDLGWMFSGDCVYDMESFLRVAKSDNVTVSTASGNKIKLLKKTYEADGVTVKEQVAYYAVITDHSYRIRFGVSYSSTEKMSTGNTISIDESGFIEVMTTDEKVVLPTDLENYEEVKAP